MATNTWSGGTDNWNDAANWTTTGATDRVPITGDAVVINTGGATVTMDVHIASGQTCESLVSLTITAGTLTTSGSNYALTVTGTTTLSDDDSGANTATLTCNASTVILGTGKTDGPALYVTEGGTFNGGSGTHTMGSIKCANNANAKFTNTSATCTINGHTNDGNRITLIGPSTVCVAAGTIDITSTAGLEFQCGNAAGINNLTLTGNVTYTMSDGLLMTGDLTVTSGTTLNTHVGEDHELEVGGDVTVTGILTGNASAITMKSLTIAGTYTAPDASGSTTITGRADTTYALDVNGTFTHSGGTVVLSDSSSNTSMGLGTSLNNLTLSGGSKKIRENTTIAGDLTMTSGDLYSHNGTETLTVTGDVDITSGGSIGVTVPFTGNMTFGSLTIQSGGTYSATSGTTTITDENGSGYAWENQETDGTAFVHNNGLVKIALAASKDTWIKENTYYDLEVSMNAATNEVIWIDITGNAVTVLGDLTITQGLFEGFTETDTLTVHGNTYIAANGKFEDNGDHTGAITHHGLVTNSGTYKTSSGTNNFNGGVRNLGTFTSDDTLTIGGTGGILEGNLDDAIINVNTDAPYLFDESDDLFYVAHHTDFDHLTALTLSAWMYASPNTTGNANIIVCKNATTDSATHRPWSLEYNQVDGGSIRFASGNATSSDVVISASQIPLGTWAHVAATFNDSSNTVKIYINGVLDQTDSSFNITPNQTSSGDKSVSIGGLYSNDSTAGDLFEGSIADVRVYNTDLGATDVAVLASKINGDINLGAGTTNMRSHWALINGSPNDEAAADKTGSAAQHNLTAVGSPAQDYDAFSVNVQDNTTTTDGAVTVTQGKLEGLSLSSVDFVSGNSDNMQISDHNTMTYGDGSSDSAFTFSAWVNMDEATHFRILSKGVYNSTGEYSFTTTGSDQLALTLYDESVADTYEQAYTTETIPQDKWVHVTATYNGVGGTSANAGITLYIDGVAGTMNLTGGGTYVAMENLAADVYVGRYDSSYADGSIRDVKMFDYELSADQVSSLYSGSYNVTPRHWWKMDDNGLHASGATYFEDYGWDTDLDGISSGGDKVNGTLDLDSSLTINTNGTFSAARGIVTIGDDLLGAGTYTHNNGTLKPDKSGYLSINMSSTPVFYELEIDVPNSAACNFLRSFTVEKELKVNSSKKVVFGGGNDVTLTLGTASSHANFENYGIVEFDYDSGNPKIPTITGASSLHPARIINTSLAWDTHTNAAGLTVRLANIDYQMALTTGTTAAVTLQLTGDCEFDAVTVSPNDVLDLNGQRMECSGVLSIPEDGDMLTTNGGLIVAHDNIIALGAIEDYDDANVNVIVTGGTGHNWRLGQSGGGAHWAENILTNGTVTYGGSTQIGAGSGTSAHNPKNIIVGSGTFTGPAGSTYLQDLTIATGGTFTPNGTRTVDLYGDFTTSGGLLGASCLELDRSNTEYVDIADHADLDTAIMASDEITLECWFKTSDSSNSQYLFDRRTGDNSYYLYITSTGDYLKGRIFTDGTTTELSSADSSLDVIDGKWHHAALVYDQNGDKTGATNHQLWVDGKMVAGEAGTGAIAASASLLRIGGANSNEAYMNGAIDEARLWSVARTPAQLRADMFQDGTLASATGLVGRWQFNEGTGSAAEGGTNVDGIIYDYNGGSPSAYTDAWAGAGTFTYGTSTLVMAKSGTQYIYGASGFWLNNLTVNNGSTTKLSLQNGNSNHSGDLITVGSGVFESDNNETVYLRNAGDTITVATPATGIVGIEKFITALSGTLAFPACSIKTLDVNSGDTVQANGDMTFTEELQLDGGTFNANGNTIAAKIVDVNGGTLDLSNSALNFSVTYVGDTFDLTSASTLTTGNTTITGNATNKHTPSDFHKDGGFEVVGDVKWLNVVGDLTVIGAVTDCSFDSSTDNIRQWHHTLDTQQLLDADSGGDDDLRLTRPALDNAHELMTG